MNYCAIIGDIVASKKIQHRQEMQDHFKEVLSQANRKYDKDIASNFTVTLGDEFQGLLFAPSRSIEIIQYFREQLHPTGLVFGIGIGKMLTNFSKESSVGSDGPAYWFARQMVEKAKNKKPSVCISSGSPEDKLMNSLIYFAESCMQSQTKRQREMIQHYKELGSQQLVAKKLDINQSVVSVVLQNAFFKEIESSYENLRRFLEEKWGSGDHL